MIALFKHIKYPGLLKTGVIITGCISILYGCKKGDKNGPDGNANTEINTWITDSLKRYYYWADQLPANPNKNQEPISFFNEIKNSADRFSYINLPGQGSSLQANSRSKFGFDYVIFKEPTSNQVLGLVTLVLNTSPAQGAGLRRGQYFTKINGTALTESNAADMQTQLLSGANTRLEQASLDGGVVKAGSTITIQAAETLEQTALQKTFFIDGKRTGYLFFTAFNANERDAYLTVFDTFKADNITDLILDLRYNAGGDVSAAAAMCSMLAPGINSESIFIEYRGNRNGGIRKESFSTTALAAGGPSFAALQQRKLNLTRLYVLTTGATASAAELLINNLRPYINIIHIGQTTRGKDEASITISDKRAVKKVNWVMYPIVYKVFNSLGNGGYSNGIAPNKLMIESAWLPLQAFGNEADPMINYALGLASGKIVMTANPIRSLKTVAVEPQPEIYNSAIAGQNTPLITNLHK
jgi:carboxyl-terminal processing protease